VEKKMNSGKILLAVKDLKVHFPIFNGIFLKKKAGAVRAVDGISFQVKEGETLGLVGESGCGKSTTARAIARLCKPTAGEVIFDNKELSSLTHKEMLFTRMDLQMIFQDPYASLNPRMTAGDIIMEPLLVYTRRGMLKLKRTEMIARVEDLMEKVGLCKEFRNRYPHEFSGGQRQRIGVARALALRPKFILADEPVSALDVSIQSQILNLLHDIQEELRLTFLFIAHDLAVIEHISDRIAVMYLGKIVEISDSSRLYNEPLHPYTEALLSAVPIPDPEVEKQRKRIILPGDVPSPTIERTQCYFYKRCPKRMDQCSREIPELREVKPGHQVACFLYE
jgi:oligopeptide transport system ATP-binding protein